jgi:DNA-binding NarL/FixJ family response regulator
MRTLLVADHRRFRAAARAVLEHDGYEVVGEAGSAGEALLWLAACSGGLPPAAAG